jgi:hypothetical protein
MNKVLLSLICSLIITAPALAESKHVRRSNKKPDIKAVKPIEYDLEKILKREEAQKRYRRFHNWVYLPTHVGYCVVFGPAVLLLSVVQHHDDKLKARTFVDVHAYPDNELGPTL